MLKKSRLFSFIFLLSFIFSSCGGYSTDPELFDTNLWVDDSVVDHPFITSPDFKVRLKKLMENSAAYWEVSTDKWSGWRIRIKSGEVWCGGPGYAGCTDPANQTITITLNGAVCLEHSPLLHEFGHASDERFFLGIPINVDHSHSSPLWTDWQRQTDMWQKMKREDIPLDDPCQTTWWIGDFPIIWGKYW